MILSKDSRKAVVCLIAFASLGLSLLISAPGWAQVVGATLSGTVIDTSRDSTSGPNLHQKCGDRD
jgi:hypothetical protein